MSDKTTPLLSILAVDPQKHVSGVVILDVHELEWTLREHLLVGEGFREALHVCFSFLPKDVIREEHAWPHVVLVEDQYLGRNPQTLIALVRASTRWEDAAAYWGLKCELVKPSTWQSAMLGKGNRETLARQAEAVFADRFPGLVGEQISEHIKSAALIGVWYAEWWLYERRAK